MKTLPTLNDIRDNLYIYLLNPNIEPDINGEYDNIFDNPQFITRSSWSKNRIELKTVDGQTLILEVEVKE